MSISIKAILLALSKFDDAQLSEAAKEAERRTHDKKLNSKERQYWHIRYLLILNEANERHYQQLRKGQSHESRTGHSRDE